MPDGGQHLVSLRMGMSDLDAEGLLFLLKHKLSLTMRYFISPNLTQSMLNLYTLTHQSTDL